MGIGTASARGRVDFFPRRCRAYQATAPPWVMAGDRFVRTAGLHRQGGGSGLPEPPASASGSSPGAGDLEGCTMLVVEDNPLIGTALEMGLKAERLSVIRADSGCTSTGGCQKMCKTEALVVHPASFLEL